MTEITPWKVESVEAIDYNKLIDKFGCKPIDNDLINRFERVTNKPAHVWIRRGKFFCHRQLELILDRFEQGKLFGIYTGRGPSSEAMHLGHLIPFKFAKYLQDVFGAIVIIQMSDDEKFIFDKLNKKIDYYNRLTYENAKDIIACGFNPNKTFIFSNLQFMNSNLYRIATMIGASTTGNKVRGIYGFTLDNTIGQMMWPAFQIAPAFYQAFPEIFDKDTPILVPMAIDQNPYFKMANDFAEKYKSDGYLRPSTISSKFLPSLAGINYKASSSDKSVPPIFLTDSNDVIRKKIKKYSFSGGGATKEDHIKFGANLEIDICYQYLTFFLDDDDELYKIAKAYRYGIMMSSEIKQIITDLLCDIVNEHKTNRDSITNLEIFFDYSKVFDKSIPEKNNYIENTILELKSENAHIDIKYGINFDSYFGLPIFGLPLDKDIIDQ